MLVHQDREAAKRLLQLAQEDANKRWRTYASLAGVRAEPAAKEEK